MKDARLPLYLFGFIFSLLVTVLIERRLIPALKQRAKQPIFEQGPSWHSKKSGTPTMGGLAFLIASTLALCVGAIYFGVIGDSYLSASIISIMLYSTLSGAVGILDDITKIKHKENAGLTPSQKLLLQIVLAAIFLLVRHTVLGDGTYISFKFGSYELGFLYYPLCLITLVGTVNCANLTDGIDGLASGVAFAIGLSMFYMSYAASADVALISSVMSGAALGFLFFNLHPAKIFMGDTGSLFFGGLVGGGAICLGNPFIILFVGIVYLIEGLSVIIQVFSFKLRGKRVFLMAPIHHHLEKSGYSENKIVLIAIFLTLSVSSAAYTIFI